MKLNRTGSNWNRLERNKINENWDIIEGSYNDVVGQITDEVVGHLIDSAKLIWKEPVDTVEDLPANAEVGETRMVREADPDGISYVYRYDGENWEKIQAIDVTLVNEVDRRLTAQLAETMNKVSDFNLFPQSPRPPKQGVMTSNPKIVQKTDVDEFTIIQKANKGYLHYVFNTKDGGTGDNDFGGYHELLRLKKVKSVNDCYVYYDVSTPKTGALSVYEEPSVQNQIEDYICASNSLDTTNSLSSKQNSNGVGMYELAGNSEVTYQIPTTKAKKMNILIMGSNASSDDVDILINENVIRNINPRTIYRTGGHGYGIIEFECPIRLTASYYDEMSLTVRNNGDGKFYFGAFNFYFLEEYTVNRPFVNNFKVIGNNRDPFIDSSGASDYALQDENGIYFGSYHGGEKLTYDRITWNEHGHDYGEFSTTMISFADIDVGEWRILSNLKIQQETSLIDKATMFSEFDFNIDGTIEMKFGLYDSSIPLRSIYTALTSTNENFDYVLYPSLKRLPVPNNENIETLMNEGMIVQYHAQHGLELVTRYTRFNELKNARKTVIWNRDNYRKFYSAPVSNQDTPVLISNLSFSKGLDFIIR